MEENNRNTPELFRNIMYKKEAANLAGEKKASAGTDETADKNAQNDDVIVSVADDAAEIGDAVSKVDTVTLEKSEEISEIAQDVTEDMTVTEDFAELMKRFEGDYVSPLSVRRPAPVPMKQSGNKRKTVPSASENAARAVPENQNKESMKQHRKKSSFSEALIVIAFFLVLTCLLGLSLRLPDREYSERENRTLAVFPKVSASSIANGDFMSRFESYLSDQIAGRDILVSMRSAGFRLLGKNETNGVIIGRNGRLFEKPPAYDEEKVGRTVSALSAFSSSCGIENQAFLLIPNASYVLPDELPSFYQPEDQGEQIKRIYSELPDTMTCFDAAGKLLDAENRDELYYKNDHHWTTTGAKLIADAFSPVWKLDFSAHKYVFHTLSASFYGTLASSSGLKGEPDTVEACIPADSTASYLMENPSDQTKKTTLFDLGALDRSNHYEVFFGGNFPRINISTLNGDGNKLLILKDSYANCLIPMLTPYFSDIVIIDARYYTEKIASLAETEHFTHLLVLYNVNTFLQDTSLKDIL